MRSSYEWIYRIVKTFRVPIAWVFGIHPELAALVESRRIAPCRAIDLGCGVGREANYLASMGFDVTGIDISPTAIDMARKAAKETGVGTTFLVDDVTTLTQVEGPFDLVVDYGTFNDLDHGSKDEYMQRVMPLTRAGTHLVLMCFDRKVSRGEIEARFGRRFEVETISAKDEAGLRRRISVYLMERRQDFEEPRSTTSGEGPWPLKPM